MIDSNDYAGSVAVHGHTHECPNGALADAGTPSAAPMRKPTVADLLAWCKSRPGSSWKATIADIEQALLELSKQ